MTHIGFSILNSHVTVTYLRLISYCKTEKFKITVFVPAIYPCI